MNIELQVERLYLKNKPKSTAQNVEKILLNDAGAAVGVTTSAGRDVMADAVLVNATPHVMLGLLPPGALPKPYEAGLRAVDYTSPVCKINGDKDVN